MASGRTRASDRREVLENHVRGLLDEDYERVSHQRFFAARCLAQPIYAEQVIVGTNIYAKKRTVDFILYHPRKWPDCLVIQCKWQATTGSVEEKYPFEVECIVQGEFKTVIVLDGSGYSDGARQWLLAQRGKRHLLHVFNMSQITRWQSQGRI